MDWVDPWVGLARDFSVFGGLGPLQQKYKGRGRVERRTVEDPWWGAAIAPPRKTARKISPTISFILDLKPSFSANPSHRSLSFSSSGLTTWIPQTFTVTSEHIRFYFLVFLFYTF